MLTLKSFVRWVILANLLLAGILLPTLHLHLIDDHDHQPDRAHRHGVVHADFLEVLAQSPNEAANSHQDVDPDLPAEGIGLLALTSHLIEFSAAPVQDQILLPEHDRLPRLATISLRRRNIKNESPPHRPEVLSLASPRSPPRSI